MYTPLVKIQQHINENDNHNNSNKRKYWNVISFRSLDLSRSCQLKLSLIQISPQILSISNS